MARSLGVLPDQYAGAEVELVSGQKLTAKMVVLADGVHSKTARKYHKMPLDLMQIGGWRCVIQSLPGCPLPL